jgi:hypothetical protein
MRFWSGTIPPAVLSISPYSEQPKTLRPPGVVSGLTTLPPTRYVSVTYPQMHTLTAEEVDQSEDENDTAALELGPACLTQVPGVRALSYVGLSDTGWVQEPMLQRTHPRFRCSGTVVPTLSDSRGYTR